MAVNQNPQPKKTHLTDLREYAAKHYTNKSCLGGADEFDNDLKLVSRITVQISRIINDNPKANIRKLINYYIIMFNVFEPQAAKRLLFALSDMRFHAEIKAVGVALGRLREEDHMEIVHCKNMEEKIKKEIA